jgi:hypothetical protein
MASANIDHDFGTDRALLDGLHGARNLVSCTDLHGFHHLSINGQSINSVSRNFPDSAGGLNEDGKKIR